MQVLKIIIRIILFCLLTVLTQIGGIVYVISLLTHKITDKWTTRNFQKRIYRLTSFLVIYTLTTFLIVPFLAKPLGRVPLPLTETHHIKPLNVLTCFLNRNYVRAELKQTAFEVAEQMNKEFPGTTTNYLDANFPFINQFPLFPHLSHNDGKKLDISFCYKDSKTGNSTNKCPSFIGYGICEEPLPNEQNTSDFCTEKGYWQYNLLTKIVSQDNKKNFIFDDNKTKSLVNLFAKQANVEKIFIEPHLKTRLKLTSDKVRFQGCQAVRHDDHLHIQIK